jgi:hypothetical protein
VPSAIKEPDRLALHASSHVGDVALASRRR